RRGWPATASGVPPQPRQRSEGWKAPPVRSARPHPTAMAAANLREIRPMGSPARRFKRLTSLVGAWWLITRSHAVAVPNAVDQSGLPGTPRAGSVTARSVPIRGLTWVTIGAASLEVSGGSEHGDGLAGGSSGGLHRQRRARDVADVLMG